MSEWEPKLPLLLMKPKENVTFCGVPSWMLVLMNKMLEETGKGNLLEIWPNLEVYFHGGVNFEPYHAKNTSKDLNITKYTMPEGFFSRFRTSTILVIYC
jgi:hypothetical protein